MAQKIDGHTLPDHASYQELKGDAITKNFSLDGTMFVDFSNVRKGWVLTFEVITKAEYEGIRAKYEKQFTQNVFLRYEDDELAINTDCFLSMPEERDIIWNKNHVADLTILLEPKNAVTLS